jgi:hypothetical protein
MLPRGQRYGSPRLESRITKLGLNTEIAKWVIEKYLARAPNFIIISSYLHYNIVF